MLSKVFLQSLARSEASYLYAISLLDFRKPTSTSVNRWSEASSGPSAPGPTGAAAAAPSTRTIPWKVRQEGTLPRPHGISPQPLWHSPVTRHSVLRTPAVGTNCFKHESLPPCFLTLLLTFSHAPSARKFQGMQKSDRLNLVI